MAGDAPFLERLAQMRRVAAPGAATLLERLDEPNTDPVIGPLFGADETARRSSIRLCRSCSRNSSRRRGDMLRGLIEGPDRRLECGRAGAVVDRLREAGLPQDDMLLRLQKLSPTLGFASENRESAREWLADPFTQDALLVQQCVVRMLFALRAMAESRAEELTQS